MIVISDSNIIFSCFYKPSGVIATILQEEKKSIQFIAPDYLLEEVKEHLSEMIAKTGLTKRKAYALLAEFTRNITFYQVDNISKRYVTQAQKIVENIDPDDYPFVALHLEQGHKIWTCDAKLAEGLKEKGYYICVTTQQLKEKIYKKST